MNPLHVVFVTNLFRPYPGLLDGRFADVIGLRVFDLFLFVLMLLTMRFRSKKGFLWFPTWLLIFVVALIAIYFNTTINHGSLVSSLLALEIFRPLLYVTTFFWVQQQITDYDRFLALVRTCVFVMVALLFVRLVLPSFADVFMYGEKFKTHSGFFRAFPLTPNPNWSGLILTILFIFGYCHKMDRRTLLLLFGMIIVSGSRTAFLCWALAAGALLMVEGRLKTLLLAVAALGISLSVTFSLLPSHLKELISGIDSIDALLAIESLAVRLSLLEAGWPLVDKSPWLGYGNVRGVFGITDNQFLHWLLFGGVIWFAAYLVLIGFIFFNGSFRDKETKRIGFATTMVVLVAGMSGSFVEQTQIMILAILLIQIRYIRADRSPNEKGIDNGSYGAGWVLSR